MSRRRSRWRALAGGFGSCRRRLSGRGTALGIEPLPLGDIAVDLQHIGRAAVADEDVPAIDQDLSPIAADMRQFALPGAVALEILSHYGESAGVVGVQQLMA